MRLEWIGLIGLTLIVLELAWLPHIRHILILGDELQQIRKLLEKQSEKISDIAIYTREILVRADRDR
jgi:exonuclease I